MVSLLLTRVKLLSNFRGAGVNGAGNTGRGKEGRCLEKLFVNYRGEMDSLGGASRGLNENYGTHPRGKDNTYNFLYSAGMIGVATGPLLAFGII